ncbi:type II toxin-antitoxin system VapC family toxin [Thermoflexus sp.]|uniref:type II toxin-antitoxin system VapC family toxin n=1 Tax=Thermoflexus sp. TaxID=1969742 RepID=UPI0035E41657
MRTYVLDTHALIWYLTRDERLSPAARQAFQEIERGEARGLIPVVVLLELIRIEEKDLIPPLWEIALATLLGEGRFEVVSLDLSLLALVRELPEIEDLHDRVIVATARRYGAVLVTYDETIRQSGQVETLW